MENMPGSAPTSQFKIRRMDRRDIDLVIEWAAIEGWNPGIHDGECFYNSDPDGFFIGDLSGEPIGCISAVAYDDSFGFLGLYIVKPEFRGKGFGIRLWNAALAYLGNRNIGLDGVLARQEDYERSGFTLAYKNRRYAGIIEGKVGDNITDLKKISFRDILAYDSRIFPAPRPKFLQSWIARPDAGAYGYIAGGKIAGYGVIRKCRVGYKIGPLFADNQEAADDLFHALASRASGAPLFLDVPETNMASISMAERHGMHIVFETVRMYRKKPYLSRLNRVFGVTTFELG